jgi:hypothetical protein
MIHNWMQHLTRLYPTAAYIKFQYNSNFNICSHPEDGHYMTKTSMGRNNVTSKMEINDTYLMVIPYIILSDNHD